MRSLIAIALLLLSNSVVSSPTQAATPPRATEIWLGPPGPEFRAARGWPPSDFMAMFDNNAPWATVMSNITEFRLTSNFIFKSSNEEMAKVIGFLTSHHIKIAMHLSPLTPQANGCGTRQESFGAPLGGLKEANRIRQFGGTVDAIIMDEPLWNGHFFTSAPQKAPNPGCQLSISATAALAAERVRQVRSVFPNARLGDIEPFSDRIPPADFVAALTEWFAALKTATGRPLDFFQADIVWHRPAWRATLQTAAPVMIRAHIPFGVVFNGTRQSTTDAAWVAEAQAGEAAVETIVHPQQALFESWTPNPGRLLPESDPTTMTGMILAYLQSHPR